LKIPNPICFPKPKINFKTSRGLRILTTYIYIRLFKISRVDKSCSYARAILTIESKKRKNGSNSTNSYIVPEDVFEVLKNKQFSDVCPKSHKETNLFFEKMSRP